MNAMQSAAVWRHSDQGNVLLYVGAVGQVGEDGVHVLDVGDGDSQVGEPGEGPQFILILITTARKKKGCTYVLICLSSVCKTG